MSMAATTSRPRDPEQPAVDSKAIARYHAVERLRDGRLVTIRAIRPEDKAGLIDALERVSAESPRSGASVHDCVA